MAHVLGLEGCLYGKDSKTFLCFASSQSSQPVPTFVSEHLLSPNSAQTAPRGSGWCEKAKPVNQLVTQHQPLVKFRTAS